MSDRTGNESPVLSSPPPEERAPALPGATHAGAATQLRETTEDAPRKCPYLAGRPPHGSHHLWPSSVNVCYARPREEKPYGPVSKETQAARCLCGREAYEQCSDFKSASERPRALPVFEGRPADPPAECGETAPRRGRRRERHKRHRRSSFGLWLGKYSQSPLACAFWLLLMAMTVWFAVHMR